MTAIEMSNEFDVLYNNINSPSALGLTEYEKSVFLTRAQNEIIEDYFSPTGNKFGEGFDRTPTRRHVDFNNIIKVKQQQAVSDSSELQEYEHQTIYEVPSDVMIILNERLSTETYQKEASDTNWPQTPSSSIDYSVYPIKFETYRMLLAKPFAQPAKNQAWRLFVNAPNEQGTAMVKYAIVIKKLPSETSTSTKKVENNYYVRYVTKPTPIITASLVDVSIDNRQNVTDCILDPAIHQDIVQRAVELAKGAMAGDLNTLLALGSESQTALGPGLVKK